MSRDIYPKYQLPSGNWTTDKATSDRIWARHNGDRPGPGCQRLEKCPDHPLAYKHNQARARKEADQS